jgi:MSHA biogenesis protein MshI
LRSHWQKGIRVFLFKSKPRDKRLCGLTFEDDGIALALVDHDVADRPRLLHCSFHPAAPGQDQIALLKNTVALEHLHDTDFSLLLPDSDYRLMMVETPEVPPEELRAAIRWRIRELIDFHIDDAVLDIFELPPSGPGAQQERLYVAVARSAVVQERVDLTRAAGAEVKIVDIPELGLRNIAARLDRDAKGRAMLYLGLDHGLITITRGTTLYLARKLEVGYRQLREAPLLLEHLALELQRSMDYYDRHFRQVPINSITLCPMPQPVAQLEEQLTRLTGISVSELELRYVIDSQVAVGPMQFSRCLPAIGAALRSDPARVAAQ